MNVTEISELVKLDPYPFQNFAPTLSQCYLIVIAGYLAAKFHLLSPSDIRGVNNFASYFAMPGIICISLADADFSDFRWELLIGLIFGKSVIFFLVAAFSLLISGNYGAAGLLTIFCVFSNDLPVGNPLVSSLYRSYRPHMIKYLFLMPALTVVLFLPMSNFMMKKSKKKCSSDTESTLLNFRSASARKKAIICRELTLFINTLIKNPIVLSTTAGLLLNAFFKGNLPEVVHKPIKVIAETIPGIALLLLGFSIVRKERYLLSSGVVLALVLVFVKMLLTPLLMHTITRILLVETKEGKLLTDFSLLYGIISPATVAFQTGQEYRTLLPAMSVALILSSFTCFPLSFLVARFTIAPVNKLSFYLPVMRKLLFGMACISVICDVFVWVSTALKKQWSKPPYCYAVYLAFTQMATSCGIIVWYVSSNQPWALYFQLALYFGGEIAEYLWSGTVAIVLVLRDWYPEVAAQWYRALSFTVLSLSLLIISVMCLILPYCDMKSVYFVGLTQSKFEFSQLIATSILLSICLALVSLCLLTHFKKNSKNEKEIDQTGCDNAVFYFEHEEPVVARYKQKRSSLHSVKKSKEEGQHFEEQRNIDIYEESPNSALSFKLYSLIVLIWITMSVKLISNVFKLLHSQSVEIMIPIEFLQSSLFVGQGVFIFLTFGIDLRTISVSILKKWRHILYGKDFAVNFDSINPKMELASFCNQFYTFYFNRCYTDLTKDRKWKSVVYHKCFWGHQLVDWLIEEQICKDDVEAEEYGQKLLRGGVIRHVTQSHHFYDGPYLYHFLQNEEMSLPKIS